MAHPGDPPPNYETPPFPSLNVKTLQDKTDNKQYTLYYIGDAWRFTVIWTLIAYVFFHLGAVLVALFNHGPKKSTWKFIWAVPIIYLITAGLEALLAGSIVGLM